jgi:hypothetical protein
MNVCMLASHWHTRMGVKDHATTNKDSVTHQAWSLGLVVRTDWSLAQTAHQTVSVWLQCCAAHSLYAVEPRGSWNP